MRRLLVIALIVVAGVIAYRAGPQSIQDVLHLLHGSPHERYAARLRLTGGSRTAEGRRWLAAASESLEAPERITLPQTLELDLTIPSAVAFEVGLRRGERFLVEGDPQFIDLFRRTDDGFDHVVNAAAASGQITVDIRSDGVYVLRIQRPARIESGPASASSPDVSTMLSMMAEPSLLIPVQNATVQSIHSLFGADRDGGRRQHHGVDIFAPRGTPVVAAGDGIVSGVGTNNLGGNVVWITRPRHLERHYYAHLDQHLVTLGERVQAGDVIGTVGNSGNARTTATHLHFGIYAPGGAVDPLPYVAPRDGSLVS